MLPGPPAQRLAGASPAKRLGAGVVDVLLLAIAVSIIVTMAGDPAGTSSGLTITVNDRALSGGAAWALIAGQFAYFLGMEAAIGATLGKLALGLRVTDLDGGRPSAGALVVRTVLRPVDGFPYVLPNLLGFIVLASTERRQRIGELASKTLVVDRDVLGDTPTVGPTRL